MSSVRRAVLTLSTGRFGFTVLRPMVLSRRLSTSTSTSTSPATSTSSSWDLYAALCLSRPPLLAPELNWLERRVKDLLARVEVANSLLSDHERRHQLDVARSQRIASGVDVDEKDLEEAAKQTAQDFEESSMLEAKAFQPMISSRVTKADLSANLHSVDRHLDKHLFFTMFTPLGPKSHWLFPQEAHQAGESLRQTAERALCKHFPTLDGATVKFLGNTPAGHYQYRYPSGLQAQRATVGARIFLFKCNLEPGHPRARFEGHFGERVLPCAVEQGQFAWLTRTELAERMPERYWTALGRTIYPDQVLDLEAIMAQKQRKLARLTNRLKKMDASSG